MTLDPRRAAVLALARKGDVRGAIEAGEALVRDADDDPGFRLFLGLMWARIGAPLGGVAHLRRALDLAPDDLAIRTEFARALSAAGDIAGVREICAGYRDVHTSIGRNLLRIEAHTCQRAGNYAAAESLFGELIAADSADHESWLGLGESRLALGLASDAIGALLRAVALRPDLAAPPTVLALAYASLDEVAAGLDAAQRAVRLGEHDPRAHLALARLLAMSGMVTPALERLDTVQDLVGDVPELLCDIGDIASLCLAFDRAEPVYRAALALAPGLLRAYLGLGDLLERTNRLDALSALLGQSHAFQLPDASTALLRARLLQRRGKLAEALDAAQSADDTVNPTQRAHLIGVIADRMGDSDTAFAMFVESNRLAARAGPAARNSAVTYRNTLTTLTNMLTPEWYASWSQDAQQTGPAAPVFLFGFPRSGTTLLDTMLLGHPDTIVLEEEPVLQRVANQLGPAERLPALEAGEIAALRARYFAEVDAIAPASRGRTIVDKFPLGLVSTPLAHRIFPNARFIFAQRHPCDVVLSCFMTQFKMNPGMANFLDLGDAAKLYDRTMTYWERCRAVLPISVATVRYETLIADPEVEIRRLAEFAGLEWTPRLVDHRSNAAGRGYIGSPSYAQVSEPLYSRAAGRWHRYRKQLAPILPILEPWVVTLGYSLEA